MNRHVTFYQRGVFVDIAWLMFHGRATVAEINAAVTRGELAAPSPNAVADNLVWDRDDAWRWIDARGVKRSLRVTG